MIAALRSQNI